MNYTYTKLYELPRENTQFDLDLRWAGENFGERYNWPLNTAGTWDADVSYRDHQLRVEYSFVHCDEHVMFVIACGGN